jgi:hypothetical protein
MHVRRLITRLLAYTCPALCTGILLRTFSSAKVLGATLWEKPQRRADKKIKCGGVADRGLQHMRQRPLHFADTSLSKRPGRRL